jgi:hypothetical protein
MAFSSYAVMGATCEAPCAFTSGIIPSLRSQGLLLCSSEQVQRFDHQPVMIMNPFLVRYISLRGLLTKSFGSVSDSSIRPFATVKDVLPRFAPLPG